MRKAKIVGPKQVPCTTCENLALLDAEHVAAVYNWLTYKWEFHCRPCYLKTLPPPVKKTKASKGREKFSKLMRSAMRKKRVSRRKVPCLQSGTQT